MGNARLSRTLLLLIFLLTPTILTAQNDHEAREELSRELMRRGELDSARAVLEEIITEAPDRSAPYVYRAQITWMQGKDPIPDLTRAIERDPENAEARATRAEWYISQGGFLSARGDARKAQELDTAWGYPYFLLAQIAAGRGDTLEAIGLLTDAIDHDWKDARTYFERGRYYATVGEFAKAEADLTASIDLEPGVAATYVNRSDVRYSLEDMDGACEDIGMVLKLEKGDPRVVDWATDMQEKLCDSSRINYYVHRGIAAYNRGAFAEAIDHYNAGLRKFPGSPTLRWARGNAKLMLGDLAAAEAEYRYALDSIDRHVAELAASNMSGNYDMFGGLESLKNATIASLYLQRAEVAAARGETEEAIDLVDAAIPYAPSGSAIAVRVTTQRGMIAMEEGKREDAETYFRAALRDAPNTPAPTLLLSMLLLDRAIDRSSGAETSTTSISIALNSRQGGRPVRATIPVASSRTDGTISREAVEEAITLLSRLIAVTPEIGAAWYLRSVARHLIGAEGYCEDMNEAKRLGYPEALQAEGC